MYMIHQQKLMVLWKNHERQERQEPSGYKEKKRKTPSITIKKHKQYLDEEADREDNRRGIMRQAFAVYGSHCSYPLSHWSNGYRSRSNKSSLDWNAASSTVDAVFERRQGTGERTVTAKKIKSRDGPAKSRVRGNSRAKWIETKIKKGKNTIDSIMKIQSTS